MTTATKIVTAAIDGLLLIKSPSTDAEKSPSGNVQIQELKFGSDVLIIPSGTIKDIMDDGDDNYFHATVEFSPLICSSTKKSEINFEYWNTIYKTDSLEDMIASQLSKRLRNEGSDPMNGEFECLVAGIPFLIKYELEPIK